MLRATEKPTIPPCKANAIEKKWVAVWAPITVVAKPSSNMGFAWGQRARLFLDEQQGIDAPKHHAQACHVRHIIGATPHRPSFQAKLCCNTCWKGINSPELGDRCSSLKTS